MQSQIFNLNWNDFNFKDPQHRKQLAGAMQYFCALPARFVPSRFSKVQEFVRANEAIRNAQVQAFTLPTDFPEKPLDVIQRYQLATDYDTGYERIFDTRNFAGVKTNGFDVLTASSGLTFRDVKPGEKLKVYQMSGEKQRCYFTDYGAALGWHRRLFEEGDYWTIESNAIEFRNKAYSNKAAVHYALLEAAADLKGCCSVVPAGCSDCHADAISIAKSINYAAQTILTNTKNKGYGLNPQTTQFVVLTPLGMRGRVRQALNVRTQSFGESDKVIDFNFLQVTSLMLTNQNRIIVALPGRKMMSGDKLDLTLFDDFDILSYTDTVAGWMRFGACIGDLDQIECITFTAQSGSCPS